MTQGEQEVPKPPGTLDREPWWKPWTAPGILLPLLGAVALLGYMVFYRIPDIEKQLERSRSENAERSTNWEKQQHERFTRIETQLVKVRINLLRLCMRGRQPDNDCQLKDLVATVNDLTTLQAQLVTTAKFQKLAGQVPIIRSPELQAQFASSAGFPAANVTTNNPKDIARLMAWATAADDAHWTLTDGALKVRFTNGSAVFTPHQSVSAAQLARAVEDLNSASEAVSAASSAALPKPVNK